MPPSRGRADAGVAASLVTPAAAQSSRSISSRKIFVSTATARGARHADRAGEAEAEEPALEIAAEFVLDVSRHGPLGGFGPLEPAFEVRQPPV